MPFFSTAIAQTRYDSESYNEVHDSYNRSESMSPAGFIVTVIFVICLFIFINWFSKAIKKNTIFSNLTYYGFLSLIAYNFLYYCQKH